MTKLKVDAGILYTDTLAQIARDYRHNLDARSTCLGAYLRTMENTGQFNSDEPLSKKQWKHLEKSVDKFYFNVGLKYIRIMEYLTSDKYYPAEKPDITEDWLERTYARIDTLRSLLTNGDYQARATIKQVMNNLFSIHYVLNYVIVENIYNHQLQDVQYKEESK
jgi:hypothetical protein